jgi:hypothetical protein
MFFSQQSYDKKTTRRTKGVLKSVDGIKNKQFET